MKQLELNACSFGGGIRQVSDVLFTTNTTLEDLVLAGVINCHR